MGMAQAQGPNTMAQAQGPNTMTAPAPAGPNVNQLAMQGIQGGMQGTMAAGAYQPMQVQAGQLAGTDLAAYENPYTQSVVDAQAADVMRNAQIGLNQLGAQMGSAGAFGGSRHGVAMGELGRGALSTIGQQSASLRQAGFNQAQQAAQADIARTMQADLANQAAGQQQANRMLGASQQLANIGNLGFGMGQTIQQNLMNQGNMQQLAQQQLIDAAKQQFSGYTGAPAETINYVSQALGASPIPQSQTTSKNPGLFDYLSLGASAAGAFM